MHEKNSKVYLIEYWRFRTLIINGISRALTAQREFYNSKFTNTRFVLISFRIICSYHNSTGHFTLFHSNNCEGNWRNLTVVMLLIVLIHSVDSSEKAKFLWALSVTRYTNLFDCVQAEMFRRLYLSLSVVTFTAKLSVKLTRLLKCIWGGCLANFKLMSAILFLQHEYVLLSTNFCRLLFFNLKILREESWIWITTFTVWFLA